MLINEVCNLTGLTKKAITYYEKQGLVNPSKGINGYREYSNYEIVILKEISLYRKLDIGIKEIKNIIVSKDKKSYLNKTIEEKDKKEIELKMHKRALERLIASNFNENDINLISTEIDNIEKSTGDFISKGLIRSFPKGIGNYLAYHFSPYLKESLDSLEKYKAWIEIINFLDNVEEINVPKIVEIGYKGLTEEIQNSIKDNLIKELDYIINATKEELKEYEKLFLERLEKQNDISLIGRMKPFYKFKKDLNEFFKSSGYYDIFLPNMKILSENYREYSEKLNKANEILAKELGIKYDENMKITISKN